MADTKTGNPLLDHEVVDKALVYNLIVEEPGVGVERYYFWILNNMKKEPPYGFGYKEKDIYKVKDIYTSSETSSYWGSIEQRKGLQQEKASQYLATVGRLVKDLFQIVREMRIHDERLQYYTDSYKGDESAEVALKGVWIDLVEGGAKQPTSVFGLASEVGFTTLPDLFFSIHPKKSEDVDKDVEKLKDSGINRKVREVLKRKLKQYMLWKEKTFKELTVGRNFKLKYLRQHYNVIKMYLGWTRPYLKNIRKLQQKYENVGPNIVTAFETSEIELELLGKKTEYEYDIKESGRNEIREFKKYFPCLLVKFRYIAIPQMAYQQEYQRGAIHVGRTEITTEAYVCTQEQIEGYMKKKDEEDIELIDSVYSSMEALGDDLKTYLEEAGEVVKKEEEKKEKESFIKRTFFPHIKPGQKQHSIFDPFKDLLAGFGEFISLFIKIPVKAKETAPKGEYKIAVGEAKKLSYPPYYVMKKAYGMLTE